MRDSSNDCAQCITQHNKKNSQHNSSSHLPDYRRSSSDINVHKVGSLIQPGQFHHWRHVCNSPGVLAGNQTQQDFLDRIKLGGINERIGAHVQVCQDYRGIVAAVKRRRVWIQGQVQEIDIVRQPQDGVKSADENHGLDDVGLNLIGLSLSMRLSGAWSSGSVACHHFCLKADNQKNAPVTEDEDEEY